jgi:Flp pilus assembly protein TadD
MNNTKRKQVRQQKKSPDKIPLLNKRLPLVLFLLAFLIYSNTISFQYAGDDSMVTYNNAYVQKGISSFSDIVKTGVLKGLDGSNIAEYRPVVVLNFALEKSLFGNSPKVNHFFNVFFYALLCALLFIFLRKLFKGYLIHAATLITVLFILHPIHTEVVANIKSRDEILCMLFGLLTLNYIFEYIRRNKKHLLIYSFITFFLCLMSKESGYSYLALIPLLLYFFSDVSLKKNLLLTLPFVAIAGLSVLIRMNVLDSLFVSQKLTMMENSLMAATNWRDQLATNFTMLLHSLELLFFPVTLSWDYSFNQFPIVGWNDFKAIFSLLIHVGLIIIAVLGFKKKNIFSFTILFYFVSSFITSNLVIKIGSSFGERFLFAPSLAFCIAIIFLLSKIFSFDFKKDKLTGSPIMMLILSVIFLFYSFKTVSRSGDWKDSDALFASGAETSPNSIRAHNLYANSLRLKARAAADTNEKIELLKAAISEFQKSLEIYPNSGTYYEIGLIYYSVGDTAGTAVMMRKALELNPDFVQALNNYGILLLAKKEYSEALNYFIRATKNDPNHANAFAGAAACYQKLNDVNNAILYYEKAIHINPSNAAFANNLYQLYQSTGDTAKAGFYKNLISSH